MDEEPGIAPALQAVIDGRSLDPFAVLGPHRTVSGAILRVMVPGAFAVTAVARDEPSLRTTLSPMRNTGLFVGPCAGPGPYLLRIDWGGPIQETEDPYSFGPLLGELDVYLLAEGKHRDLAQCLGAHQMMVDGLPGVRFAVWAPNARRVSVVGDFKHVGRPPPPDAAAPRGGRVGDLRSSAQGGGPLQIRAPGSGRRSVAVEGRSGGVASRAATRHSIDSRRPRTNTWP
jgi:1,4-alpha-glucan branching enzyme